MPRLNVPQNRFLALPHKFRAFLSGYGGGKTWVGSGALCKHALEWPRINAGYFAPTFPHIRDIFFPTIEEVAEDWGLRAQIREANKEVHLYGGGKYRSTIICRSMERPGDIIGFKIGRALVDELDMMKKAKAAMAWRKIIARMRQKKSGLLNGVDVTTTPEGFGFVYEQFVKQVRAKPSLAKLYGMVQASTYDNGKNLPDDYISSMRASYPSQLIEAYIDGKFVNLASGSVYPEFCRTKNHSPAKLEQGEALHVGLDFNVLNMTAVLSVVRDDKPITIGEITKVRDTPAMAALLKQRYLDTKHAVTIYPDASGGNTSSKSASESDLSILRQAGFQIRVNPSNPAVRDRINSVNAMLLNAEGERRWLINTDNCPTLTEALEQQPYDTNGEPDKSGGLDHCVDAAGYMISQRWPIARRVVRVEQMRF